MKKHTDTALVTTTCPQPSVPFYPLTEERAALPLPLWQSLKNWKTELEYFQKESEYLKQMLKWNDLPGQSSFLKNVCDQFNAIVADDLPVLLNNIRQMENQLIAAWMSNRQAIDLPTDSFRKLEKKINRFRKKAAPLKLQLMKELAHAAPVTFY
ncbi:MAG TPA: hypothetical protein ENJ20_07135 [Bacteroidetes bacterium]|nr:hypothetical protein [Bacteroidota bacterium]